LSAISNSGELARCIIKFHANGIERLFFVVGRNGLERRSKGLQPLVTPQTHEEPIFCSESLTMVSLFKLNVERVAYSLMSEKTFHSTIFWRGLIAKSTSLQGNHPIFLFSSHPIILSEETCLERL
jgi:hypothetical protein